ncbi:RHS repeat-associated core domain-containing protein [Flavobacterium sp.]|uniref:RHS repeat-associated core domain-containing protein n=1 Tax=Flavobacterium sp. TaxID=239 RepID=UPI003753539C
MKLRLLAITLFLANTLFSQNFHDTQGKLEISSAGQATYTLPIAMPASIKDVGPIINLVYASGQNGGIVGQGWNINSISNIARISTRQDIDGFRDGVDFDADDKLALDGQRLLLKSGTGAYWSDGSQYETEVQSNTKIELKGVGTAMYFIVTSPDGSRAWYGNYGGMDATDATAYYIVRFEDANSNFITYHYAKPFNKSLCITEIRFSANTITNATPLNKIVFSYKLAARYENAYIKGIKLEKVEILDKVEVFTNNLLFKKYQLTHITDDLGYQRVSQIQEFNGAGEAANPVLLDYNVTSNDVTETGTSYDDYLNPSTSPDMSGDFDGDGAVDFISGKSVYTKLFQGNGNVSTLPFTDSAKRKFAAVTLSNNKINQKQSIVHASETLNNIAFKVYNLSNSNTITLDYTKDIQFNNLHNFVNGCETDSLAVMPAPIVKESNEFLEGDFNGDGLSEVLIFSHDEYHLYGQAAPPLTGRLPDDPNPCSMTHVVSRTYNEVRLVDLNPNVSNTYNTSGNFSLETPNVFLYGDKKFIMDMNLDGKADVFILNNDQSYKIISFKQLLVAPWVELEIIGQGTIESYSPTKQILFGDYNGDGKPDIMLPDADINGCETCDLWHIYYSNPNPAGGIYFVKQSHNIVAYRPSSGNEYNTQWHNSTYYAMDVNKDGKSDLVKVWTNVWQYSPFWDPKDLDSSWTVDTYVNNIGLNGGFTNNYTSSSFHHDNDNSRPIPLVSNFKFQGLDSDLLMIRFSIGTSFNKSVTYVDFQKDVSQDNLLTKVTQSGGAIVDEITYNSMTPTTGSTGLGALNDFYSSADELLYPLVELKQMPTSKIVSQLKNTSLGVTKMQDFKYHGLSFNLNSIGLIGFKKTARSSWYKDSSEKRMWSAVENNPLQRGATVRTYNQLLNSFNFTFLTNYTSGLLSKSENIYTELTDPITKKYSILLNNQTSTDYLTNIISQKVYNSYSPDYLLPLSVTSNNYLGTILHGSTTTVTDYDNVVSGIGSGYYIGRPKEINTTATIYVNTLTGSPDTKTSNEKYFYTNGNLTQTEKKANGSAETLIENSAYFPNGLLKSKTISATGTTSTNAVSARSTSYTYDPTNRFVKTITDSEGMVATNNTYNPLYGVVLSQTNPLGQTTTSIYDNWGKRTKITDFLGKNVNYTYTKANNIYTTTQVGDDGSSSIVDSDALARIIRKGSKDINDNWVYSTTEYDYLGKKVRDSEPYFSSASPTQWTAYEYDDYSKPIKTTYHTGKVVNTVYNGLTITANDGVMSRTKTTNANGQVVSATDTPGGTITYKYDAMGSLLESDYSGVKITMQYDNWGRKTQLTDSSAGTYTYSYNAYGEALTEGTPKGLTSYILNPVGKLITKTVVGATAAENTNITSTYSYDATNKWLTNIAVTNPNDGNSNYAYTYDTATKQLKKTIETLPYATFTKELTFDLFGRVNTETSIALAHSKTSPKTITHAYKNGVESQLLDGTMKSQVNTTNARGQVLSAALGNGIAITNTYDTYGYITQNKHLLGTTNVMTLDNVFEPTLGNLTSRYNSMFDARESFTYDTLDRLTSWDGIGTNLLTLPFNTTTDGFTFTGTSTTGSVTNVTGTMKVVLKNTLVAAKKTLTTINVATGNKLRVKGTITGKTGTSGVIVDAVMVETDPLDALNYVEIPFGTVNNGVFDANYTVSDFVANPKLTLKFIVDESSPESSNGGGTVAPNATFFVDNLTIDNVTVNTQNYDDRGKITENALGQYKYTNTAKPYQNTSVFVSSEANAYYTTRPLQGITYNAFKSPIQIEEQGIDKISFGYNAMQQRSIMYYGNTDTDKLTRPYRKYYSADGSMEIKATFAAGNTTTPITIEFITYVGGDAYSAPIVIKSDGTTQNYFYLHRDYQGSILAVTNETGGVVEKRLFDAWGAIAKVQDGAGNNLTKLTFFDRGYTGHQHLESVGLIHMNGRLYDPKLHRFLQPDNFVQDPYNTQNFNRYGYCLNNPLKFTDVSGEEYAMLTAAIVGAAIAVATYLTVSLINNTPITFPGLAYNTVVGGVSGAITSGIGTAVGTIGNFWVRAGVQALAHGLFQGGVYAVTGGKFWNGFAAGAISSIASSLWAGGTNTTAGADGTRIAQAGSGFAGFGSSGASMIVFGTIAGGAGAALTGGNFWQGAVTGLVVSGLNHYMHPNDSYEDFDQEDPVKTVKTDPIDASKLDPKFKTNGKDWEIKGGRHTITTKKEILQWDYKKGEIEVYNKANKQHLGGFDPKNRGRMISNLDKTRVPNGGWNVTTSKVLGLASKLSNFLNLPAFMSLPPLFQMQMQSIPGYVNPNATIQTY